MEGERASDQNQKRLTIHQHLAAVRHTPDGAANLVQALREDATFAEAAKKELDRINDMEKRNPARLQACWISRQVKQTLTAALAEANTQPDVPAGD